MAQLRYAPKSAKKRENIPKDTMFKRDLGYLLNKGQFGLPTRYLQERGIKGEETISKAKKRLVQMGFLDVMEQGSFAKAGWFRYTDRWRTYNWGALFKEDGTPCYDGPLPGYCHYPNIIEYNNLRAQGNCGKTFARRSYNGNKTDKRTILGLFHMEETSDRDCDTRLPG